MDKKAKLFTKRIAERLSKERSHKSGKNKAVLVKSIQNVTKESLKKTLQDNIDLYFQYLNKCLKRFNIKRDGESEENDTKLIQTWHDCMNLAQLNREDKRQICVRVLLQQLDHADEELVSLVDQFEETCEGKGDEAVPVWMTAVKNLLVSTTNGAVVSKLMLYYLVKILPVADECLKSGKNVDRILACLKQFLIMSHLRGNKDEENVEDGPPKRRDVIASLLSIFIDLLLYVNRDSGKKKVSREITGVSTYLLSGDWSMKLDVLILVNTPVTSPSLVTFARSCLEKAPVTITDCSAYLKLMLCLKKFHDQIPDIVEQNLKVRAPLGFVDWLSDRSPEAMAEIPDDVRFKGRQITYFLINNQSDELQQLLEDVLTDNDAVNYLKPTDVKDDADVEDVRETVPEAEQLFMVDRVGEEKISKKKAKTSNRRGSNGEGSREEEVMEVDVAEEKIEIKATTDNSENIEVVDLSNVLDAIHGSKTSKSYIGTEYVSNSSSQDSPKPKIPVPSFKTPTEKVKKAKKKKRLSHDDTIVLDTETSSDAEETSSRLVAPDLLQHLKHQSKNQDICIIDDSDNAVEVRSVPKIQTKDGKKQESEINLQNSKKDFLKSTEPGSHGDEREKNYKSPTAGVIELTSDDDDDDDDVDIVDVDGYMVSSSEMKTVKGTDKLAANSINSPKPSRSPKFSPECVIEIDDSEDLLMDNRSTVSPSKADKRHSPKKSVLDKTAAAVPKLRSPRRSSNSISESDQEQTRKKSKSPKIVQSSTETTGSPVKKKLTKLDVAKSPEATSSEMITLQYPGSPTEIRLASPVKSPVMKMTEYLQKDDAAAAAEQTGPTTRKAALSVTEMGSIVKEARSVAGTEADTDTPVSRRKRRSCALSQDDADVKTPKQLKKISRNSESDPDSMTDRTSPTKGKSGRPRRSTSQSDEGPGSGTEKVLSSTETKPLSTPDKGSTRTSWKSSPGKHLSEDDPDRDTEMESSFSENKVQPSTPSKRGKAASNSTPTKHSKRQSSASESEDSVFVRQENEEGKSPASQFKQGQTPQSKVEKADTTPTTPKGRRSLSKSTPTVSKSGKKTPSSSAETPRRTRSSILDSPMITRSGKKINVPGRRMATPQSSRTEKLLSDIQEDDEDNEVSISKSPTKQIENSTTRRFSRKMSD